MTQVWGSTKSLEVHFPGAQCMYSLPDYLGNTLNLKNTSWGKP